MLLDYQPGTQLTAQTSYRDLKLEMRTGNTAEGREFFVEMWREGEKNINYNLDVQFQQVDISLVISTINIPLSDRGCDQHPLQI